MQRRQLLVGSACLAVLPSLSWADEDNPSSWLVDITNQVLDKIRANPALKSGDPKALRELVEKEIMPNVDFAATTRLMVGPAWRQATPEQRQTLQDLFEALLIRVYAGALKRVQDHVAQIPKGRQPAVAPQMVVNVELVSKQQAPIKLGYRIYKNKANQWKVVDLNVEGIWLAVNYNEQFQGVISQGGIEGLIKALQEKVNA